MRLWLELTEAFKKIFKAYTCENFKVSLFVSDREYLCTNHNGVCFPYHFVNCARQIVCLCVCLRWERGKFVYVWQDFRYWM